MKIEFEQRGKYLPIPEQLRDFICSKWLTSSI